MIAKFYLKVNILRVTLVTIRYKKINSASIKPILQREHHLIVTMSNARTLNIQSTLHLLLIFS